jgi:hypothetical protein
MNLRIGFSHILPSFDDDHTISIKQEVQTAKKLSKE